MARKRTKRVAAVPPVATVITLRLYIAGGAPNSTKAIANLEAICKRYLKDAYQLEVVDVCEQPLRALSDRVVVTPSLTKLSPGAPTSIVGNLSDAGSVLAMLGLHAGDPE